ncbi:MAG: cell division protein FtsA [Terriglobales bacterium]
MSKDQQNLLVALDIGSAKTFALVAEATEAGLRYRGHGVAESRGSRKGVIVDLDKAVASIQRAVEQAEQSAGVQVDHAVVSVGGTHIRGITSRSGLVFGSKPREIGREEVRQALDKARSVSLPPDRQVMHLLPQEFILDDQGAIRDPNGMLAAKLEAQVHMITAQATVTQSVVTAANRAGVEVTDTVYEGLVAGDCVLKSDERELGVVMCDIGAGTTELLVLFEGAVAHSGVVPIGGDHFTNDVAVGLRTPLAEAEKLKRSFGSAVVTLVPEGNELEVPAVGDRTSKLVSQRFVAEILEPRATELFEHVRDNLRQGGVLELCAAGSVLTGGGALLANMPQIAEQTLRKPSRVGLPSPISKMPAQISGPEYSVAIGTILYAHRGRLARNRHADEGFSSKIRSFFAKASM